MVSAKEIKFPVPWGQISGKSYGDENNELIMLIHGMADNAASFDTLIPLLPTTFNYIAIDLPGHGKSTPLPEFFAPYTQNFVYTMKLIVDHFKKERYTFICHSYGSQILFLFALIYPEHVEKMVFLDAIFPATTDYKNFVRELKTSFKILKNAHERFKLGKLPSYSYEEALERAVKGRKAGSIKTEVAANLLKRALVSCGEGENVKFQFATDPRLTIHAFNFPYDLEYFAKVLDHNPVTCPILVCVMRNDEQRHKLNPIDEQIPIVRKYKNFKICEIEGGHTCHSNEPSKVAPLITEFLLSTSRTQTCKL